MLKHLAVALSLAGLTAATPALAAHRHHKSLNPTSPGRGHSVNGPASTGAGTGENKPTASGGQPGGSTGQQ